MSQLTQTIDLKLVTEIEFQQFMKDQIFSINVIKNYTQFLVRGHIVGLAIFNNAEIKRSEFYLKKELN